MRAQIELDQAVIDASRRFFPGINETFDDERMHVTVADARTFLGSAAVKRDKQWRGAFDAVFIDTANIDLFALSSPPSSSGSGTGSGSDSSSGTGSSGTGSFMQNVRALLNPQRGILVAQVAALAPHNAAAIAEDRQKMLAFFRHVSVFAAHGGGTTVGGAAAFLFCSAQINAMHEPIDWAAQRAARVPAAADAAPSPLYQYYNAAVHYAAFALPSLYLAATEQGVADAMPAWAQERPALLQAIELTETMTAPVLADDSTAANAADKKPARTPGKKAPSIRSTNSGISISSQARKNAVFVNGTGWVRIEPMVLHPVAFEALSDLNRGVKRGAQHQPFAEQCQQQIYQVHISAAAEYAVLAFCFSLTRVGMDLTTETHSREYS